MNIYERIQNGLDYIELHLNERIDLNELAKITFMSRSNFYRLFWSIVGFNVKEYIRLRRLSEASQDLISSNLSITDIALKYDYTSIDAFTRSFQKTVGILPSQFRQQKQHYSFNKINILQKYFQKGDETMNKDYPEIKILKELPPTDVICFHYIGADPETHAFELMKNWLTKEGITLEEQGMRVFGYNNPNPVSETDLYGYEVCCTFPKNKTIDTKDLVIKTLSGGQYAIQHVSRTEEHEIGFEIMKAWSRFNDWLAGSKYVLSTHQYLEEHLGFDEQNNHIGEVDIYVPIEEKGTLLSDEVEEVIPSFSYLTFSETGKNAEAVAKKQLFEWLKENNIDLTTGKHRIFATYNFEKIGTDDFNYQLWFTVPKDFNNSTTKEINLLPENLYLKRTVTYNKNAVSWYDFIQKIQQGSNYQFANYPFLEEYVIKESSINADTVVNQYMPVKKV